MSCNRYTLIQEKNRIIHSDARLLYLSTAKYGGDWHSLPHTHDFTELFFVIGGSGQFSIENELYPVHVGDILFWVWKICSFLFKMKRMIVFVWFTSKIIWKISSFIFIPCKEKSKPNQWVMKWFVRIFWISW